MKQENIDNLLKLIIAATPLLLAIASLIEAIKA